MLTVKDLENLEAYINSGQLENDFKDGCENDRFYLLELLEKIMDVAELLHLRYDGPRHIECADHAWVSRAQFDDYPFSKADLDIIRALRALPKPPRLRDYFS